MSVVDVWVLCYVEDRGRNKYRWGPLQHIYLYVCVMLCGVLLLRVIIISVRAFVCC